MRVAHMLPHDERATELHLGDDPNKTLDLRAPSVVDDRGEIIGIHALLGEPDDGVPPPTHPAPGCPSRFEMKAEVGRGGMGEVYSCCDVHLNREVVAKVLHRHYLHRPEVVARFAEEIRISGQLEHPGVVPIYEAGVLPDGRPFFVMQRVWGLTLRAILDERPDAKDGRSRLLKAFEQICHTLAYAHAQRIIHRDLSPSNVMIGLFGQVKVMDWGLAKSLDDPTRRPPPPADDTATAESTDEAGNIHTLVGSVMGTPSYMPPEQARGDIGLLDERCDVFGLGAILCEILTGQPPYVSPNRKGILRLAIKADLSGAFHRLDHCGADHVLITLAKSCLANDPADRPRDAGVVVDRLTHYFDTVLRQAEWDLVTFFDLSSDFFCVAGFDGFFRRINENFSRVLGYAPADLLTRPFLSFVHPDDHADTTGVMERLGRGLPVIHFRNRYRDASGEYRWFEWMCKAVPQEDVIFAVAREVTDQVAIEERVKHLEAQLAALGRPSEPKA